MSDRQITFHLLFTHKVSQAPQPSGREPDLKFVHPSLGGLLKKPCLFCKAQHLACCIHQENETHWTTEADLTQPELDFLVIWK